MCNPTLLLATGLGAGVTMASEYKDRREEKKAKEKIRMAEEAANKQIEQNKIANSIQTTGQLPETDLTKRLSSQKVSLNNPSTKYLGNPSSVGLNLGGGY